MDYRELRRALISKGQAEEDRSRDHAFYYFEVDGKSYRATKISHSARGQINSTLLGTMARQMGLTGRQLRAFVDCELDRDKWIEIWRTNPRH